MPQLVAWSETVKPLILPETERTKEIKRAEKFSKIPLDSRAVSDLFTPAMGAYTPLDGFMGHDDWGGSCLDMKLTIGLLWLIPITPPVSKDLAAGIRAKQTLHHPAQHIVFQDQIEVINAAQVRLAALEQQLHEIVPTWTMAPVVAAYQALRGVSFLVAITFVAEVGDVPRFATLSS